MTTPTSAALGTGRRRTRFNLRAFYIVTFYICALGLFSLVAEQIARYKHDTEHGPAQWRAVGDEAVSRLRKRDEECRLVHDVPDQCAFIKANCLDEEAGLFSYLTLYYCDLENAQPVAFIMLVLWLGLLFSTIGIAASDFFCINLSTISALLGMSESMAGVTFLAFGNGSPDVFSTFAAMNSHSGSLAIGELMGAAGFITAVVAGSMALVREFKVGKRTFVRDIGFFIVAVSFSMYFLADGRLHFWECATMIGFYVFYVITVVVWHWYLQQRRRRRERFAATRGYHLAESDVEIDAEVDFEDDEEEDRPASNRRLMSSRRTTEEWNPQERSNSPTPKHNDEEDDNDGESREERRLATEMSNSMRVVRRRDTGIRRNTLVTPIRPSLVGAMEFRSVLASLQKSQNHGRHIHMRRYSDDPYSAAITPEPPSLALIPDEDDDTSSVSGSDQRRSRETSISNRTRAVSMNDAVARQPHPEAFSVATIPDIGVIAATPMFLHPNPPHRPGASSLGKLQASRPTSRSLDGDDRRLDVAPPSPSISISPSASMMGSREPSPAPVSRMHRDRLAPPGTTFYNSGVTSGTVSPRTTSPVRPTLIIPNALHKLPQQNPSPTAEFPAYTDTPSSRPRDKPPSILELPESTLEPQVSSSFTGESKQDNAVRPVSWWPYDYLPDPYVMRETLFPTLTMWRDKSLIDKFLSIVSAPSIFLLAVTLPVVESEMHEDEEEILITATPGSRHMSLSVAPRLPSDSPSLEAALDLENEGEWTRYRRAITPTTKGPSLASPSSASILGLHHGGTADVATAIENSHHHHFHHTSHHRTPGVDATQDAFPFPHKSPIEAPFNDVLSSPTTGQADGQWNRWLVIVQLFTAPLFVMLIIWANSDAPATDPASENLGYLLHLVLYSPLGSLIALFVLLATTSPTRRPRYRPLLCFLGFIVSISWISTIANEVVGVLKAFGVILGISDAILGLTIFAVGNSLGDLVADITVARLGYPVMALSACFGGPMLNILLGIGGSGVWMMVRQRNHRHKKHPGKEIGFRPYQIEVSGTLMISAVTLLVTLCGLLIVVPMNKWMMTRKIGYGLIALWCIGTIINLAVEITGVLD